MSYNLILPFFPEELRELLLDPSISDLMINGTTGVYADRAGVVQHIPLSQPYTNERLQAAIERFYLSHAAIGFYARELNVTESRLNRACRAVAGCSPLELIQDRLLLEARRKLTYIAAPVSTLAYELGFEDPAYFWRFFKRHTGMTPAEFRDRTGRDAAK